MENINLLDLNSDILNIIGGYVKKDNSPYGATMIYLLSESHLSAHTFVDEGKITLDLFTCDVSLDEKNIKKVICDFFGVSFLCIDMYCFTRG